MEVMVAKVAQAVKSRSQGPGFIPLLFPTWYFLLSWLQWLNRNFKLMLTYDVINLYDVIKFVVVLCCVLKPVLIQLTFLI